MATPKAPLASRAMIDQVMAGDHNRRENLPIDGRMRVGDIGRMGRMSRSP
jgi:hypothetical protein